MTALVYGITPPRVLKDWEPCSLDNESARLFCRRYLVPESYGAPIRAVVWERANGDIACVVAEYPNGRRAEVRRQGHDFSTTLKWWSKPNYPESSPSPPATEVASDNLGEGWRDSAGVRVSATITNPAHAVQL